MAYSDNGQQVDLTPKIGADGHVDWSPTQGNWNVIAVGQKFSGQMVKRPAPGDEGPMLNPLYPDAMRRYTEWFGDAFTQTPGPLPEAMFQDSYEYQSNWAPDFLAQFQKLRGWPLQSQFPALFSKGTDDQTARVKHDYQETVSDILVTETIPTWVDWCHAHGLKVRYQAHGSPGNLLDLYALADVPETEGIFGRPNPLVAQFASSAAHLTGKPLASAETATWLDEHFHVSLAEIKATAEDFYLSGINHVVFHGTCYSPDAAAWPGWLFYAATDLNPRMSLWHNFPALTAYLTRCQSILQSGHPDNDVLLYWPVDELWSDPTADPKLVQQLQVEGGKRWMDPQPMGKAVALLKKRGYAYDYISDRLLQGAGVVNGKIILKGGQYSAIVVPECKRMPLETLTMLMHLADAGGTVIFENHLPSDVPGLSQLDERRADLKQILSKLPADPSAKTGNEHLLIGSIEDSLKAAGITRETFADQSDLQFIRRRTDDGYYYYLVNHGKDAVDGWFPLARPAASMVIMDAMSGTTGLAATRQDGRTEQVHLQLNAGQSLFIHALAKPVESPVWNYLTPHDQPMPLNGQWQVSFLSGGPELPKPFALQEPAFWTTCSDPATQTFSGTASYSVDFTVLDATAKSWLLSLGAVQESAHVILNGKPIGTLIAAPYEIVLPPPC
ncbi:MAG: glycosyl hydrolase [Chthoniobacteraceae bacterium]